MNGRPVIVQTSLNTYEMNHLGHNMILARTDIGWEMTVINASAIAHSNGAFFPKKFNSLVDVERRYKSWKGISLLIP